MFSVNLDAPFQYPVQGMLYEQTQTPQSRMAYRLVSVAITYQQSAGMDNLPTKVQSMWILVIMRISRSRSELGLMGLYSVTASTYW